MIRRALLFVFLFAGFGAGASGQDEDSSESRRQQGLLPVRITLAEPADPEEGGGAGRDLSTAVEVVLLLSVLTLLPSLLLTMTCFTRVIIVLSFVRRAMSTPELPPNPVLIGLALFISAAVMKPVASQVHEEAIAPYLDGEASFTEAGDLAATHMKRFMLRFTREEDVGLFLDLSEEEPPEEAEDVPLHVVIPAFVVSELKTAFTMGFVIYLPFLVVDLVISSILLSMGMFMLPPMLIATPIKILLFVLVDGWSLVVSQLWVSLGVM